MTNFVYKIGKARISTGDVLGIRYRSLGLIYSFVGLVIAKRRGDFLSEAHLIFRNVIAKAAVELAIPSNLLFYGELRGYSKKAFKYCKSKLFYLRYKKNQQSLVKLF